MDSKTNYKNMLLVLLLVVAGLAGAIAPQQAAAEDYGVIIGSKMITSENYTDISDSGGFWGVQSGTVTFDPATYTLTLNNATIESPFTNAAGILNRSQKRLHIVLIGNNTIRSKEASAISIVDFGLSITGSGRLTLEVLNGLGRGIDISSGLLQIEGCTINTTREIYVEKGDLIIKNATVNVNLSYGHTAFSVYGLIELEGCSITRPAGARIESFRPGSSYASYRAIGLNGKECTAVSIAPGSTKPELTLDLEELKVEAKGGKHEVTLSSKQDFDIKEATWPSWISRQSGASTYWIHSGPGLYTLRFDVQPNTGPERTADVVIKTDKGEVTLKVTQAAAGTKPEAKFTLEPKELKVEADGGKKEVKLSCNQAFELNKVTVPSWMERVPSSATSDEKSRVCAFNIKPNTGAERMGEIIFHTDKGDVTLKVTQAAGAKPEPTLTLSPDMLTFPTGGGKQTVNVKSDYGWDTKASAASASWMKLTTDVKTGKIVVEVTPNTSTKKRGATIQVVSSRRRIGHRTPITRHILVTQEAAKAVEPPVAATGISLNPAAMTMGSGGGTVGFNVYAGKGWTISGSPDWMHPDATRGSGTRLVIVRFDRNESGAERTGKLTVKSDDGKAERTFTLTQRAGQRKPTPSPGSTPSEEYDYDLALNPEEITVGPSDGAGSSISVATSRLWAGSTTEDWIRLESAVGRGNGTFTFRLAANPSKEMRHGTITVRTQQGMDELKVAIHQQGNDGSVVPPAEVKVSNVTLDPATLTVNGDLSTALISAIVSPDNARNKGLLWMSSNASVATVQVFTPKQSAALPQLRFAPDADDYALVTIVGKGKAVITAAASDGSGIVARCEVNVLSTVANTVPYAPQAKVYTVGPTLYLSLPTPETVQVYTLAGTLYRTWQAPAGDTSVTLPAGTYIIKVGPLTEKVAVQ